MVGVEVSEEVRDGEIGGVTEGVDEEACFGDEFGAREGGRNWGKRKGGFWRIESGEEKTGGV